MRWILQKNDSIFGKPSKKSAAICNEVSIVEQTIYPCRRQQSSLPCILCTAAFADGGGRVHECGIRLCEYAAEAAERICA